MRATDATWGDLTVDSYLRDRSGTVWRVCAIDTTAATAESTGHLRCKNREGEWLTIAPKPRTAPVTIMVMDGDGDQIALLRDKLGARVVATQDRATSLWRCPPWPAASNGIPLDEYRSHLELVHQIYPGDIRTFKQLVVCHEELHAATDNVRGVPHSH